MLFNLLKKSSLVCCLILGLSMSLKAQKTFNGSVNTTWEEPANWTPAGIPTNTDDVIINGGTIIVNSNAEARDITINKTNVNIRFRIITGSLSARNLELLCSSDNTGALDFFVEGTSTLTLSEDLIATRGTGIASNPRLEVRGAGDAEINIAGSLFITSNGGVNQSQPELNLFDNATLNISKNLVLTNNLADADIRLRFLGNSVATISDSIKISTTGNSFLDNQDVFFLLFNDAELIANKSMVVNKDGGDEVQIRTVDNSSFNVTENLTVNHTGGGRFLFQNNNTSTTSVLGTTNLNFISEGTTNPTQRFQYDFNGGTGNFGPTFVTITNSATNLFDLNIDCQGSNLTFNSLSIDQNDGDDISFDVREGGGNPSALTINGDLFIDKDGGDDIRFNLVDNSSTTIIGDFKIDIDTDDEDAFTFTSTRHDFIANDFLVNLTGATTVAANGDFSITLRESEFNVDDFKANVNAMRDFAINVRNSGTSFVVADSMIFNKGVLCDDIFVNNRIESSNSVMEISTLALTLNSDDNQAFQLTNRGVNDTIKIDNININAIGNGGAGSDSDILLNMDDGLVSIANDITINSENIGDLAFDLDNGDFELGGSLNVTETGTSRSFVLETNNAAKATINGGIAISGGYTNSGVIRGQGNSSITCVGDVLINTTTGNNFTGIANQGSLLDFRSNVTFNKSINANDIGFTLNDGSKINIGNDLIMNSDRDGDDRIIVSLSANDDTLIVGRDWITTSTNGTQTGNADFDVEKRSGLLSVGRDLIVNNSLGDEIYIQDIAGRTEIGRDLNLSSTGANSVRWIKRADSLVVKRNFDLSNISGSGVATFQLDGGGALINGDFSVQNQNSTSNANIDLNGGNLTIDKHLFLTGQDIRDINFTMDNSSLLVKDDLSLTCDVCTDIEVRIDNGSSAVTEDSLLIEVGESTSRSLIFLNRTVQTAQSSLTVKSSLLINHEKEGSDFLFRSFGNSKIDITNDFVANFEANDGDYLELRQDLASDTCLIGGNINWVMPSGTFTESSTYNIDDDFRIDIRDGLFNLQGDANLSVTGGSGANLWVYGGEVNIFGDYNAILNQSGGYFLQQFGGELNFFGDYNAITNNAIGNGNARWDHLGGVANYMEDVNLKIEGLITTHEGSVDGDATVNITDSLNIDIRSQTGNFGLYFDNPINNGPTLNVGNSIVIDHTKDARSIYINLRQGNATLNVTNDIIVNHAANDGDLLEITTNNANDTINVGGDIKLTMPTGSFSETGVYNGNDDINVRFNDGIVNVTGDIDINVQGGSTAIYRQDGGEVKIGGDLLLETENSSNFSFTMNDGELEIGGDQNCINTNSVVTSSGAWVFNGGVTNILNDALVSMNSGLSVEMNGRIRGDAVVNISDTLLLEGTDQTGVFWILMENSTGTGQELNVGSYFILNGQHNSRVDLNGDAKLTVGKDMIYNHNPTLERNGILRLRGTSDTLIVGESLIMNMGSGLTANENTDLSLTLTTGYASIGDSLIMNATAGNDLVFTVTTAKLEVINSVMIDGVNHDDVNMTLSGGSIDIGEDLDVKSSNSGDLSYDINSGELNVIGDIDLETSSSVRFSWDQDGGTVNSDDLFATHSGTGPFNFYLDNTSSIEVADTFSFNTKDGSISRLYLNDQNGTGALIKVNNDLVVNHEIGGSDVQIRLEGDAKLEVVDDFIVTHTVDGIDGDYFLLELIETTDTLLVGGNFTLEANGSGGTSNQNYVQLDVTNGFASFAGDVKMSGNDLGTEGDVIVDINGGEVIIGDSLYLKGTEIDDLILDTRTATLTVAKSIVLEGNNQDGNANMTIVDATIDVGEDLDINLTDSRNVFIDIESGTLNVVNDIEVATVSSNRFLWDQDGGSVFSDDLFVSHSGTADFDFYLDNMSSIEVTDTFSYRMINGGTSRLYLNDGAGTGALIKINNDLVITHETGAGDFLMRLEGDSKLEVVDDFIGNHVIDAIDGDYFEVELVDALDSLLVGGEFVLTAIGAGGASDQQYLELEVNGGYAEFSNNVKLSGTNLGTGGDVNIDINGGIVSVSDSICLISTNVDDVRLDVTNGDLTVLKSILIEGSNQDDLLLTLINGSINIGEDLEVQLSNADDLFFDINSGQLTVSNDIDLVTTSSGRFYWDQDGGSVSTDDFFTTHSGTQDFSFYLDNASTVEVADTFSLNTINSSVTRLYLNEDNGTGALLKVNNDLVVNHEVGGGDLLIRLEGDSKLEVVDDFVGTHKIDGVDGDYFELELVDALDTLLIGGDFSIEAVGAGGTSGENYVELEINNGFAEFTGEILLSGNNLGTAGDVRMDINGGVLVLNDEVNLVGENSSDDVFFDIDGGNITAREKIFVTNSDGELAEFSHQGVDGLYEKTVKVLTNNSSGAGAQLIIGGSGSVIFEDTVEVKSLGGGNTLFQTNGAGAIVFEENLYLLDTNSRDMRMDFNDSDITLKKDLIVTMENGNQFNHTCDGGDFTVEDDFIITTNNTTSDFRFRTDGLSKITVQDSLIISVTENGNRSITLYLDDGALSGSELNVGTLQFNNGTNVGDTRVALEGDANLIVQNNFDVNLENSNGGDYFEIEMSRFDNDTTIIGGDLLIDHENDNGSAYVQLEIDNGYFEVQNDVLINLNSPGDMDILIDVENDAQFVVLDSLVLNHTDGDDMALDFRNTSITTVNHLVVNKKEDTDNVVFTLNDDATLNVTNTFAWNNEGSDRDRAWFNINNTSEFNTQDLIANIDINNSNTNNDNTFRFTVDGGTANITNDAVFNWVSAHNFVVEIDGDGSMNVSNDLIINKDGGNNGFIDLGSDNTGNDNLLSVGGNIDLDTRDDVTGILEIEVNRNSIVDLEGDVQFQTTIEDQLLIEINNTAEFKIAGGFDRNINGNQFGSLLSSTTGIVTYDGTSAQVMEEDAGGGTDEFDYGIVRINNTSGLLPAVTLENNLGGGADVEQLNLINGQLYLNQERLTIEDGTISGISRTNGSIRSEDTDNSSLLTWEIGANTGAHVIPFSTVVNALIPFIFDLTAGNAGNVDLATYPTTTSNLPFSPTVTKMDFFGVDNTANVADRHWQIDVSGTATSTITFPYLASEIAAPNTIVEANLQAQRWDATKKNWDSPKGVVNTGGQTVTVTGVTKFSPWVLVNSSMPLPVTFSVLDLSSTGSNLLVNWSTSSEVNNDYFEVMVSKDGTNFESMAVVKGNGTTRTSNNYVVNLEELESGTYYVKIKQTDFNGSWEESWIETLEIDNNGFSLYPNIAQIGEQISLLVPDVKEEMLVTLTDVNGISIELSEKEFTMNDTGFVLETNQLSSGAYILKIINNGEVKTFKIVLQN